MEAMADTADMEDTTGRISHVPFCHFTNKMFKILRVYLPKV